MNLNLFSKTIFFFLKKFLYIFKVIIWLRVPLILPFTVSLENEKNFRKLSFVYWIPICMCLAPICAAAVVSTFWRTWAFLG